MAFVPARVLLDTIAAATFDPGCSGPDNRLANSAYARLKNAGVLTPASVDFPRTRVELVAQQKIGKDLYRQVHRISFTTGRSVVSIITVGNASSEECSMSSVQVELVDRVLGTYP